MTGDSASGYIWQDKAARDVSVLLHDLRMAGLRSHLSKIIDKVFQPIFLDCVLERSPLCDTGLFQNGQELAEVTVERVRLVKTCDGQEILIRKL